jgi:Siphovirus ReqiPepy6 Gp37-like protein
MDFYTMNENFIAMEVVDEFISALWVERYSGYGETSLVVPATETMLDKLPEGTFLGLRGSQEVMEIETNSIENNQMTVAGKSLVNFLDQRFFWARNPASSAVDERIVDYAVTGKPGQVIADAVEDMVINTTGFPAPWNAADLEWDDEEIVGLSLGAVDTSGSNEDITINIGPLYAAISDIARKYNVGISLYLESADIETGFVLKFKTYRGVDRTSDQVINPLIRLTPDLDSLSDVKELRSIAPYKNTVYVFYKGITTVHYEDPMDIPLGFNRRVLVTTPEDEPIGRKPTYVGPSGVALSLGTAQGQKPTPGVGYGYTRPIVVASGAPDAAFREQHAKDVLANNNYIRSVDGQTSPVNEFTYGVDYGLGDIIELESFTGNIAQARVTEYVRSQDKSGEREYPTISVI